MMGRHYEQEGKYTVKRQYNKLVRDKIPEYLEKKGKPYKIHIADEEEYWDTLKEKLQEEAEEFADDSAEEVMADMLEVIEAICQHRGIDKRKLAKLRRAKERERGLFNKRIILEES